VIQMPHNVNDLRAAWRIINGIFEPHASPGFTVTNAASTTKFYVFDIIGGYDNDASEFVQAVHAVEDKTIDLHINSPGGFVFDAVSMYDALINSSAKVDVKIHGLAASAASFLAMSGDTVEISEAGRMMIHDAQGIGVGSPADLREYADLLDNISNDISGIYAKRAGGKPAAWRSAMTATTWYSSSQAVDSKLADSITKGKSEGPDNRTRLIQARAKVLNSVGGK
jgi:ATP-dependent protease ClpP protease subunit